MNIFIIGQCTLHWGRMEFGNIGNYYIIEPFIRELHFVFPNASIKTTMQMSERFQKNERVQVLPMELYYGWNDSDLQIALQELSSALIYSKTGYLPFISPYIKQVLDADLVIDFSGDMWGDNANFLGKDRFLIGLIKDRIAQLLGKKTVMIAGSPGPFFQQQVISFAKDVYKNFDLVSNRESISIDLLKKDGFDVSRTISLSCPAFLFESKQSSETKNLANKIGLNKTQNTKVGLIICGWNFTQGPFDKWPRDDSEYTIFAEAVEFLSERLGCEVYLMSHSNAFPVPPQPFELQHGRDYLVVQQLKRILDERDIAQNYHLVTEVLDPWETKNIIKYFDILVSGRIHGAVAGLSQMVPTVIIDYGHEPKAHKLRGFAKEAGAELFIADPLTEGDLISKIQSAFYSINEYKKILEKKIPIAKEKAKLNFKAIQNLF
jgi:colanic acid/amylovoran biosynthesis protein